MHTPSLEERVPSFHRLPGVAIQVAQTPRTNVPAYALAVLALLLTGCGTPPEALRIDVQSYLKSLQSWAAVESHTMRTIEHIFATQFVDEAEIRRQIAEIVPRIRQHLGVAQRYEPRTADVEAVHEAYLNAWQQVLEGFAAIEAGFDAGDHTRLARGRALLEAWQADILSIARRLRALTDRFEPSPDIHPT